MLTLYIYSRKFYFVIAADHLAPRYVTSSLLGPNTLLNTLFLNTLSPRFPLSVSDQVSHPYKIMDKITDLFQYR